MIHDPQEGEEGKAGGWKPSPGGRMYKDDTATLIKQGTGLWTALYRASVEIVGFSNHTVPVIPTQSDRRKQLQIICEGNMQLCFNTDLLTETGSEWMCSASRTLSAPVTAVF